MSNQDDSLEPLSKKRKCGDGEAPEIIAFGGPMYDEATAHRMLKEAVRIDATFTEDGEEPVIGFDPSDAALDNSYGVWHEDIQLTPLAYFAAKGDAKMCSYLISRGASTTKCSEQERPFYPMYAAAEGGHLDVCKLLYNNGAKNDVRRDDGYGWNPFHVAVRNDHDEVVRWLVLHGALCVDATSEHIEEDRVYPDFTSRASISQISRTCDELIQWGKEVTQTHSAVVTFLGGTLPRASSADARQCSFLKCLSGHPGVRRHIFDYVGLEVTKRKHLRILRNVVEVLPSYIKR